MRSVVATAVYNKVLPGSLHLGLLLSAVLLISYYRVVALAVLLPCRAVHSALHIRTRLTVDHEEVQVRLPQHVRTPFRQEQSASVRVELRSVTIAADTARLPAYRCDVREHESVLTTVRVLTVSQLFLC